MLRQNPHTRNYVARHKQFDSKRNYTTLWQRHIPTKKRMIFRPVIVSFVKPVCLTMSFFKHIDDFFIKQLKIIDKHSLTCYTMYTDSIKFGFRVPHNFDYVVFLFIAVKVPIFEFGDDAHRLFPWCRYALYLCLNAREYQQGEQYLFG